MIRKGSITTTISMPTSLWNKVNTFMEKEGIDSFSNWVRKSSRIYIQILEEIKIKDFLDKLSEKEYELLKKEMKKRG